MTVFEDFETGASGWSDNTTTEGNDAFTRFLGRFSQHRGTEKTFLVAEGSKPVTISFDLYEIDSWDNEAFRVSINGIEIFARQLQNSLSEPAASGSRGGVEWSLVPLTDGTSDLGFGDGADWGYRWFTDQKFRVELKIADPGDQITIGFSSDLDGRIDDEAFGIDNFRGENLLDAAAPAAPAKSNTAHTIENPEKIGIGTWDVDGAGTSLADVEELGLSWYYNWRTTPLADATPASRPQTEFVQMVWNGTYATAANLGKIVGTGADTLLTFNEPDLASQADMSVEEALALWPLLMSTGLRLSSPAPTTEEALGQNSWLGRFMAEANERDYQVDFIAVHYYTDDIDVDTFRSFLEAVYNAYNKPIWVTEWALVDWANPDRFEQDTIADFARDAILMMDDLDFVERHAWFGAYEGGDGWFLNTALVDNGGRLTETGLTFQELADPESQTAFPDTDTAEFVSRIYTAAYGRAPDEAGLAFWSDVLAGKQTDAADGSDRAFLARCFLSGDEFVERYGDNPTDADYVAAMYRNVLDRNADAGGLSFWIEQMSKGLGRDDMLVFFAESSENVLQTLASAESEAWIFGA